ncbi:N-acetyltransferase family protein [Ammonicoccus fulvus]|uniref:N-acetyltransferase family protein n=1 Tax=Ammonicoccus fulvus TaxID=3138240 RepID=A0ABZ3FLP1_9ACTN
MQIQNASPQHFDRILEIYAHHVMHAYATFDERPPTMDERLPWFEQFSAEGLHQLLVAVDGEQVLGYAASLAYRSHPAFARTVEFSVYLAPECAGRGVGTALYRDLIERVRAAGALTVVTGVALPNPASLALHARCGFREVGIFDEYAEKHCRRISSQWFQLSLG